MTLGVADDRRPTAIGTDGRTLRHGVERVVGPLAMDIRLNRREQTVDCVVAEDHDVGDAPYRVDHLRSIDKRRIRRIFGHVSASELSSIDQGLELFLGLRAG